MNNLYVYCFISRNKDNKNIEGFKTRSKSILAYEEDFDRIEKELRRRSLKATQRLAKLRKELRL